MNGHFGYQFCLCVALLILENLFFYTGHLIKIFMLNIKKYNRTFTEQIIRIRLFRRYTCKHLYYFTIRTRNYTRYFYGNICFDSKHRLTMFKFSIGFLFADNLSSGRPGPVHFLSIMRTVRQINQWKFSKIQAVKAIHRLYERTNFRRAFFSIIAFKILTVTVLTINICQLFEVQYPDTQGKQDLKPFFLFQVHITLSKNF